MPCGAWLLGLRLAGRSLGLESVLCCVVSLQRRAEEINRYYTTPSGPACVRLNPVPVRDLSRAFRRCVLAWYNFGRFYIRRPMSPVGFMRAVQELECTSGAAAGWRPGTVTLRPFLLTALAISGPWARGVPAGCDALSAVVVPQGPKQI
ncbi:hypothetical protein C8Q77DRAFT_857178 [Trametes polyzona]|nr:hypothetical protein C8Q77DRAFT_857178 [Trametes polyzona]